MDEPTATDTERVIDLCTQLDALEHLRHASGLGREEAIAFLQRTLTRVLSPT
jgi:hypothetical protein